MSAYKLFKLLAFQIDPESIHDKSLHLFHHFPRLAKTMGTHQSELDLSLSDGHLQWSFPLGLAAGFDKNAYATEFLSELGFGAIEVGTVTKLPQKGNPKPRITRHPKIHSLQNSMGFPSLGAKVLAERLQKLRPSINLGINIGKNKETKDEEAYLDYSFLFNQFKDLANYIVINVSSPNTPGLRKLQNKEALSKIFSSLNKERKTSLCPLYLKLSPDLSLEEIKEICEVAKEFNLQGIIATNTTAQHDFGMGGLSGAYLKEKAKTVREKILEVLSETSEISLIGAGGISDFSDLYEFWRKGGKLAQAYTSFIYQGPDLLAHIQRDLEKMMRQRGHTKLSALVEEIRIDG